MATARTRLATALAPLVGACAMVFASGCGSGGSTGNPAGSASGGNGGGTGGAMSGGATGGATVGGSGGSGNGSGGAGGGDGAGTGGSSTNMPPDGGAGDGAAPAPGGPCTALFCESFEDATPGMPPDPAIWTRTPDAMKNVVVDTTEGALGTKKALHVPSEVNGFYYIREKKSIAAQGTKFWERVWFRIDRRPIEKPNGLFHWTLFTLDELDDFQAGKLLRFGGHVEASNTIWPSFNFQAHGNPGETRISDPMYTFDLKKWYCIEAYFSLPDQEARFWINGVEDPKLHWCKNCAMPTATPGYTFPQSLSYLDFGWAISHGLTTDWEVWVDEIAVDTKQIGCGTTVF